MCGRFTLTWDRWRRVADALGIDDEGDAAAGYRPRFNIAPTDQHFIITSEFERRKVQCACWGLVNRWASDNSRANQCINAKAETLEQRGRKCDRRRDSRSHAGNSGRTSRGRLDESTREKFFIAQEFARAGTLRFAGNDSSLTAREQRQERGSRTPPGG
jgi:SOS response associated peptidase (SRAP)